VRIRNLTPNPFPRGKGDRMLEYALAREILRSAQDDTKKRATSPVILSESCCSEESRRTPGVGPGYVEDWEPDPFHGEEGGPDVGTKRNLRRARDAR
jgi:hypothetical protein